MPLIASMFFTQGVSSSAPGVALIGTAGTPVTGANGPGSTSSIQNYEWTLIDAPSGSSLVPGFVQSGPTPTITFTPDVAGGYLWQLKVSDQFGNFAKDLRTFQVLESSGRLIPPAYAPGSALNFGGQTRGWAKYIIDYLKQVDAGGGGGVSLAGDLLGTGSTSGTPRVGSLTGIGGVLTMAATAAALIWNSAAVTPNIGQQTSSGSTGALMTVAAQTNTGIGSTGGGLALSSGGGLTSAGNLELQTGGTAQLRVTPTALISVNSNPIQFGTNNPAVTGLIRAAKGVSVVAARNSINTADYNLVGTNSADIVNVGDTGSNGTSFATSSGGIQSFLFAAAGVSLSLAATFSSFQNGSVEGLRITPNGAGATSISVASGSTSFTISQANTSAASGATTTIQAQTSTFAGSTGGALALNAGGGATTPGQVTFAVAGQASPGIIFTPDISGLGTTQILFSSNCAQPKFTMQSVVSGPGTTLQILGQTVTGAAQTAGALNFSAGNATGTGTTFGGALNFFGGTGLVPGNVVLLTGSTARVTLTAYAAAATSFTGTVSTTNGSATITFSVAQSLTAGTVIYFTNQLGIPYFISATTSGSTTATLTSVFSGTTNASNTVATGPSGVGVLNVWPSGGVSYGSTKVPLTGFIRLAGGGQAGGAITTRNNADTADMNVLSMTGADAMNIGDVTNGVQVNFSLSAGGAYNWNLGGSTPMTLALAAFQLSAPLTGSAFLGAPLRYGVGTSVSMPTTATTQTTPGAAQLSNPRLTTINALTANQDCILPTSSSTGGFYLVDNQCTGAFSVTFKATGQTGVVVANGKKQIICLNSAGTDWVAWTAAF